MKLVMSRTGTYMKLVMSRAGTYLKLVMSMVWYGMVIFYLT